MVIRQRDGAVHALDYRETAPAGRRATCTSTRRGSPTERSLTGHLAAGVPGAVAGLVEAHRRFGRLPLRRRDRAGDRSGARRLRGRRVPQRVDPGRQRPAGHLPGLAGELPARRRAARSRHDAPAAGSGGDARGDPRPRRRRVLSRSGGRPDRRRNGARRRADLARGPRRLPGDLARPDRDPLPRLHHLLDAARLVRRRHDGRDPQHHGGLRPTAAVRLARRCCIARRRPCGAPSPTATPTSAIPAFVQNPTDRLLSKAYAAELRAGIGERATPTPAFGPGRSQRRRPPRTTPSSTRRATP